MLASWLLGIFAALSVAARFCSYTRRCMQYQYDRPSERQLSTCYNIEDTKCGKIPLSLVSQARSSGVFTLFLVGETGKVKEKEGIYEEAKRSEREEMRQKKKDPNVLTTHTTSFISQLLTQRPGTSCCMNFGLFLVCHT